MMRYPKPTSVGATFVKTLIADLMVQTFVDGHSLQNMDWRRAAVFGTFGFLF